MVSIEVKETVSFNLLQQKAIYGGEARQNPTQSCRKAQLVFQLPWVQSSFVYHLRSHFRKISEYENCTYCDLPFGVLPSRGLFQILCIFQNENWLKIKTKVLKKKLLKAMAWYHIEVLYLYPIHTYSLLISLFYEEVGKVGSVQIHRSQNSELHAPIWRAVWCLKSSSPLSSCLLSKGCWRLWTIWAPPIASGPYRCKKVYWTNDYLYKCRLAGLEQCLTAAHAHSPVVCSRAGTGLADAYEEAPGPPSASEVILPALCKLGWITVSTGADDCWRKAGWGGRSLDELLISSATILFYYSDLHWHLRCLNIPVYYIFP